MPRAKNRNQKAIDHCLSVALRHEAMAEAAKAKGDASTERYEAGQADQARRLAGYLAGLLTRQAAP